MGAKVAEMSVARPGATSRLVWLGSVAGGGAGVGGDGGGDGGGAAVIPVCGNSGAAVVLLSTCGAVVNPPIPS